MEREYDLPNDRWVVHRVPDDDKQYRNSLRNIKPVESLLRHIAVPTFDKQNPMPIINEYADILRAKRSKNAPFAKQASIVRP